MTTSPKTLLKSISSLEDEQISPAMLGYFHATAQDEAHGVILRLFRERAEENSINRAFIARRLGKGPEQITRWLGAPGNWRLDTFTNLALALGHKPTFGSQSLSEIRQGNDYHPATARLRRPPPPTPANTNATEVIGGNPQAAPQPSRLSGTVEIYRKD